MENFYPFIWLGVLLVAVVAELSTMELIAVWFMPAAIITAITSIWVDNFWIQCAVFILIGGALLILSLTVWKDMRKHKRVATNVPEMIVGKPARVTERIDNRLETGAVKIDGKEWTARSESFERTHEIGEEVTIIAISGVKVIVKK